MKWLDRTLLSGPFLTLVTSEKEFYKAMKHCNVSQAEAGSWIKTATADATLHYLDNAKGQMCCIVAVRIKDGIEPIQIASMLVHESVHIWQAFCDRIGEDQPSKEFEAYSIQAISQTLMYEYAERLKNVAAS